MMGAWLICTAIIGAGPGPATEIEIATLVSRLSAGRESERVKAAARLEEIGDAALPALVKAAGSRDLELRPRAAAVLDAIEGRALARPTLVTLDFRDRPLSEVVDAIADRTGLGLILDVVADPKRAQTPITLVSPSPVPFWEALDRLGKVAGVRPDTNPNAAWNRGMVNNGFIGGGIGGAGGMPPRRPGFGMGNPAPAPKRPRTGQEVVLIPDPGLLSPPAVRSGRFEISVLNIHLQRDRVLGGAGGRPPREVATDRFEVRLRFAPEPGLLMGKVGEPEGLEVVDDRGQSLLGPSQAPDPNTMYYDPSGGRAMTTAVRLRYPDEPGQTIRRLKGTFRVTVVGTRPDPVVASLVEKVGTPARRGDVTLTVHSVKPATPGPKGLVVEVSLARPDTIGANGSHMGMNMNRPASQPPQAAQGWFEFVDDQGRQVERIPASGVFVNNGTVGSGVGRRILRVNQPDGVGPPVAVRYLAPTWTTLAVPFEFRDLPMP